MNDRQVQKILNDFEESLDGALISTNLWKKSAITEVLGLNTKPDAIAGLNEFTNRFQKSISLLKEHSEMDLKQVVVELDDNTYVFVIELGRNYRWNIFVSGTSSSLGMLRSLIIPETCEELRKVLT